MKFGEAWELMQTGRKVKRESWKGYLFFKDGEIFCRDSNGTECVARDVFSTTIIIGDVLAEDWMLVEEPKTEKPKKVFISQPMAGKTQKQIITERVKAVEEVQRILGKVEIIDTVLDLGEDALPLEYLGESIKLLAKADVIYLMEGWQNARGCRVEHECAESYGIAILMQ